MPYSVMSSINKGFELNAADTQQVQTGHAEAVRLFIVCQLDKARHRESFFLYQNKTGPIVVILCPQGAVAGRRGDRRDAGEHLQGDREGRATR